MTQATRLPVILVTGFLGSGKTTMLRHLLRSPKAADTAIIVNEIGAVGLDHHLLWTSTETTVVLENGCVCCSLREDLAETLSSLFWQRLRREIPRFERIVVETTGLADPRHVVATFATDPLLVERFRLQSVITTVDAVLGMERHERHDEWAAQIGMADTLLLTKTDLASADQVAATTKLLGELNPLARVTPMARGDVAPEIIWQAGRTRPPGRVPFTLKPHRQAIDVFTATFEAAVDRDALHQSLVSLAGMLGEGRLLRSKGLVLLKGETCPWLVESVGPLVSPPERLDQGQTIETSMMVFITAGWMRERVIDTLRGLGPVTCQPTV